MKIKCENCTGFNCSGFILCKNKKFENMKSLLSGGKMETGKRISLVSNGKVKMLVIKLLKFFIPGMLVVSFIAFFVHVCVVYIYNATHLYSYIQFAGIMN